MGWISNIMKTTWIVVWDCTVNSYRMRTEAHHLALTRSTRSIYRKQEEEQVSASCFASSLQRKPNCVYESDVMQYVGTCFQAWPMYCSNKEKQDRNPCSSGRPDVVLIMGFGATHGCWEPQLSEGLLTGRHGGKDPKCRILMMDNRGVGSSGCPEDKRQYTTAIMAQDVLNLLVSFCVVRPWSRPDSQFRY